MDPDWIAGPESSLNQLNFAMQLFVAENLNDLAATPKAKTAHSMDTRPRCQELVAVSSENYRVMGIEMSDAHSPAAYYSASEVFSAC